MAGALLGRACILTGESRYVDVLAKFLLEGNIQQDSGLFWHCRSAPFYWGRGNGFAAMGLTETLTYLPDDHAARGDVLDDVRPGFSTRSSTCNVPPGCFLKSSTSPVPTTSSLPPA